MKGLQDRLYGVKPWYCCVSGEAMRKQKEKEEKEAAEVKALRKQMEFKVRHLLCT